MRSDAPGRAESLQPDRRHNSTDCLLAPKNGRSKVLITGGAGFIGTNLADCLLSGGHNVMIFDNLSRGGSDANLSWLLAKHKNLLEFEEGDVRDSEALRNAVKDVFVVFHLAAQVAVTDSLTNPRYDFQVNAGGTLQLLEAIRQLQDPPALLFTSTNKVYGTLSNLGLTDESGRYAPHDQKTSEKGISESQNLDFHSPYGCSKGAADQYILDYARTFRLPAVVLRMSCIYGPHQNGTEDQGWVAHFLISANKLERICIYGDGTQVRDLLYIDDLLDAFEAAVQKIDRTSGEAFNIGGGLENAVSLLELLQLIKGMRGEPCSVEFAPWRHADQRYYVSDTEKFRAISGWEPHISVPEGLRRLQAWLIREKENGSHARFDIRREHSAMRNTAALNI